MSDQWIFTYKKYRGELNEKVLFMSAAFVEHVKVYGDKRDNI